MSNVFYQKYCLCRDSWGVYNLSDVGYYYHIDREFVDFLKVNIDEDKERFYVYPFFHHHFSYSLEVTNQSLVFLTYNNNSIIKAEYQNHTEIFASQMGLGNWYLNFTQIPFAPNTSSTIILNDIFLKNTSSHTGQYRWYSSFQTFSYIFFYLLFRNTI